MRRLAHLLAACVAASAATAATLPPEARAEIDGLLSRLEGSGCEINRNGIWYPAAGARAHLMSKLKYLEDRGAVETAEQFIERAGSKSSLSGRPYLIRCGELPPVETGVWLSLQLQAMRSAARAARAP